MKQIRVEEVRSIALGWRLSLGIDTMVTGVSIDSRTARPGDAFIAIRGERFDGHNFLSQAADAGCVTALVRRETKLPPELAKRFPGGVIGVADTVRALGELALHQRKSISADVAAITGSNGKTTVKSMVHHILSSRLQGYVSPKSYNNEIGVPLTLLETDGAEDYVICELGTNAPGEIANLGRICQPDIAVITSISPAHLEKLGSLERIASEKASIIGALRQRGLGIVWADNDLLDRSVRAYQRRLVRFGASEKAELRLTGYEAAPAGARFELNGRLWVQLSVPGRHNALNALSAIAVAQRFGFDQDAAAAILESFEGVAMRMQRIDVGSIAIYNDAYNANPASMRAAGDVLADLPGRRRVMILGDMRELGETGPALHEHLGEDLAAKGIECIVGIGQLGQLIARGAARAGCGATESYDTLEQAAAGLGRLLNEGDVVLLKGSRAMGLERLVEAIRAAQARKE